MDIREENISVYDTDAWQRLKGFECDELAKSLDFYGVVLYIEYDRNKDYTILGSNLKVQIIGGRRERRTFVEKVPIKEISAKRIFEFYKRAKKEIESIKYHQCEVRGLYKEGDFEKLRRVSISEEIINKIKGKLVMGLNARIKCSDASKSISLVAEIVERLKGWLLHLGFKFVVSETPMVKANLLISPNFDEEEVDIDLDTGRIITLLETRTEEGHEGRGTVEEQVREEMEKNSDIERQEEEIHIAVLRARLKDLQNKLENLKGEIEKSPLEGKDKQELLENISYVKDVLLRDANKFLKQSFFDLSRNYAKDVETALSRIEKNFERLKKREYRPEAWIVRKVRGFFYGGGKKKTTKRQPVKKERKKEEYREKTQPTRGEKEEYVGREEEKFESKLEELQEKIDLIQRKVGENVIEENIKNRIKIKKPKKPKIGPLYCPICAEMGIRQKLDLNKMECPSNRHSLYCYNEFENKWKYLGQEITPLAKIGQEIRPLTREEAEQIVEKIEEKREKKGGIGKFTVEKFKNFFLRSERTRTTKGQPAREEEEKEHREKTPPPGEEKEGIKAEVKAKLKRAYEYKPPKTFWKFDIPEFMGLLSLGIGILLTLTGWLGGWFIGPSLIVVGLIFAPLGRLEFKHHLGLISFVTGIIIAFYVHFWGGIALAFLGFGLLVGDIFEPIGNVIKYIAAGALLILIVPPFLSWIGIEVDFVALGLLTIINSLFLYIFWGFEEGKSAKERLERELLEEELKLTKARKEWIMEKARNLKKRVIRRRGSEEEGEEEEE